MFGLIEGLANLSLMFASRSSTFCDLDTVDGDALLTKHGEYVTFLEGQGLRRLTMRRTSRKSPDGLRLDCPGHSMAQVTPSRLGMPAIRI